MKKDGGYIFYQKSQVERKSFITAQWYEAKYAVTDEHWLCGITHWKKLDLPKSEEK